MTTYTIKADKTLTVFTHTGTKGDPGPQGMIGPAGRDGDPGPKGEDGLAATIAVGNTTKGSVPEVINRGTSSAAIFDFVLPENDPDAITAGYIDNLFK